MKIAFFSDTFYPEMSGISDSLMLNAAELARRGHHVEYFVPAYGEHDYQVAGILRDELGSGVNMPIHRIPSFHYPSPTLQGRAVIPNLLRGVFSPTTFDIIHTHTFFGAGLDALSFAKRKHIPLIGTNHTLIEAFGQYGPIDAQWSQNMLKKFVLWYYDHCDRVTTPSDFLSLDMRAKGLRPPVTTVSNPIESPFFISRSTKDMLKKELGFTPFTFLYAGRFSSEKNLEILIDAFLSFAGDIPDVGLVLVGQGVLRSALAKRAGQGSAGSRIKIIGPFLGNNKQMLYDSFHASDVFVMPSTSETQSMTTLQAMASGMSTIAADSGPLPGLLGGDKGILFGPESREELAAAFRELYSDSVQRKKLGEVARLFAKKFSEQHIAGEWEKIYTAVIKEYDERHKRSEHQPGDSRL